LRRFVLNIGRIAGSIPTTIYDARHPDTLMENVNEPCGLEALHLQPGDFNFVSPSTRTNDGTILLDLSVASEMALLPGL
jgi:hypothetical protein